MLPSRNELLYFLEVASTRNVSRAAERLGVSQPALSQAMARLERTFGTGLLLRTRVGVRLTPAGEKFAREARGLLDRWERIKNEALRDQVEARGRIVLGCHASVALYALELFLPRLLAENPELEVKLAHDLSRRIVERVISFEVDVGITVNPVRHPDLAIRQLCRDEVGFWRSKSRALGGGELLVCDPELLQTQALLKKLGRPGWSFRGVLTSSSLEVVRSMTAAGVGVGILPGRVARQDARLRLAGEAFPSFEDRICLVYRADTQKTRASKLLIERIAEGFRY